MTTENKNNYTYDIVENGFYILKNGKKLLKQLEPFIPYSKLSYEENALKMIEELEASDNAPKLANEVERLTNVELALAELYESQLGGE